MLEQPTVLVVQHDQQALVPQFLVRPKRVVDIGNQVFSEPDVVRGMLIVGLCHRRMDRKPKDVKGPQQEFFRVYPERAARLEGFGLGQHVRGKRSTRTRLRGLDSRGYPANSPA